LNSIQEVDAHAKKKENMLKLVKFIVIVNVSLFAALPAWGEDNKAIVRHYYAEVLTKGNVAAIDDLVSPTYVGHDPAAPDAQGTAGLKQRVTRLRTAFPDLHVTVEDMVAEGDKVATRLTLQGTHKGEFRGIAPTGRQITWTATSIIRLQNGKFVEGWANADDLGRMRQLGAVP
jgi:steroid delta-isomerase-like uncharacterized protein